MCIALALTNSFKKKKDGEKAKDEENARVVNDERPVSPSSRLPQKVSQVPTHGSNRNGKSGDRS
jgi:hypothetical protein